MNVADDLRTDLPTAAFDFDLPPDLIAQSAAEPRDSARLLHVTAGSLDDRHVYDLPDILRAGDLLIFNDTRVIPARLKGTRGDMRVEAMLHKPLNGPTGLRWLAFAKPGKRLRLGDTIRFGDNFTAQLIEKRDGGEVLLDFATDDFPAMLACYGEPPLPPYIKRDGDAAKHDSDRYQTVYAARDGAVAAPTAGLHFTPALLDRLRAKGIDSAMVTLHVGAGTFQPVKVDRVKDHVMHSEWIELDAATADRINAAKRDGRRVVCVGTTALRVLESAMDETGRVKSFTGDTAIFITPGYRFRACDVLLTNFHLPCSTLFMLVAAFMGLDRMRAAYAHAIAQKYRFYSFGDASLLERA